MIVWHGRPAHVVVNAARQLTRTVSATILRMRRHPTEELLDTDSGTPAEVAASIRDLRWFNRWFGGVSTAVRLVKVAAGEQKRVSILDVAAGEGFVPKSLQRHLPQLELDLTLLDRVPSHFAVNGTARSICGDALALPFRPSSFDLVSCSLFVHHLAPEQVVLFVKEALRICRVAVLIHDLIRDPLHLAFAYAGLPLYRSRVTRHDAIASVRQAYTVDEMGAFLQQTGAARVEIFHKYFYRMGAIVWKAAQ